MRKGVDWASELYLRRFGQSVTKKHVGISDLLMLRFQLIYLPGCRSAIRHIGGFRRREEFA